MNPIQFKCSGDHYFTLDNLTEFQGELKKRTKKDIDKIKKSIKKHGFVAPFFYFVKDGKNFVLDGHGRLQACRELISDGIFFEGAFPCVEIKIDTEEEAKEILLKINSQYGKMTKETVNDFLCGLEINFDEISLPKTVIDFSGSELEKYTQKTETPIYKIKGECPKLKDLTDLSKYNELITEIDKKNIPEEIKKFLVLAAGRHVVFDYEKIAEYYSHADKEIQGLFENSALVIIDYDKSIELGYTQLTEKINEL